MIQIVSRFFGFLELSLVVDFLFLFMFFLFFFGSLLYTACVLVNDAEFNLINFVWAGRAQPIYTSYFFFFGGGGVG